MHLLCLIHTIPGLNKEVMLERLVTFIHKGNKTRKQASSLHVSSFCTLITSSSYIYRTEVKVNFKLFFFLEFNSQHKSNYTYFPNCQTIALKYI